MEWKNEYSLGIREIDEQHKQLLERFSVIELAIEHQRGWREILYGIVDLKSFARIHFEVEEALMRLYGYADNAEHEKSHQNFFIQLADLERLSRDDVKGKALLDFLIGWLQQHILGADRGYAEYILSGASVVKSEVPNPAAD